ncbi:DUF4365 domain-containing protein [Serratia sp. CY37345]|uniref:DUF4365 domain-containing protein n=1 Tax=Serratia sp. CY37345 TaxID=3383610 RepID=UPI003F9F37D9
MNKDKKKPKQQRQYRLKKSISSQKTTKSKKKKIAKSAAEKNKAEGMTFLKSSAEGHAGEFLFAYWISRYFKWPCRLLDTDMGLDAQVEIYKNELSTGMFIGVQVKTTSRKMEDKLGIQIPYKNIKYWGDCDFPIVITLICLNEDNDGEEPEIYWKHLDKKQISKLSSKASKNLSGCTSVTFSKNDDYLAEYADKPKWVDMWMTEEDKKIIEIARSVNDKLSVLGKTMEEHDDDYSGSSYLCSPDLYIPDLNNLLNDYEKINNYILFKSRLIDLNPDVANCISNYNKYIQKALDYFEHLVCSSIGAYPITEDFNTWDTINPILNRIIKENYLY